MRCSVEHESLSITTLMFCERQKAKVLNIFPPDEPESEYVWSPVLFELPATASSSGSARPLIGQEEGLEDSCFCCLELVPVSGIKLGMWSWPHAELCSLLTSTSGESFQVLFSWLSPNEPLGEQLHFCQKGLAKDSKNEHQMEGVPSKGRSGRRCMAGGGVSSEQVELMENPGAAGSSGSVTSTVALLCHKAATSALLICQRGHW